jgi:lipopolysaccharide assembly protein A
MAMDPQDPQDPQAPQTTSAPVPDQRGPGQDQARQVRAPLPHHKVRRTRISGMWVAIACFAVVLLLLLVFILQNSESVDISYFGAHGHLPLGAALLLAAVCGVLLVAAAGTARIVQLRATARRHRAADAQHVAGTQHAAGTGQPARPRPGP